MGQKINPIGFRVQINRTWDSRWFADGKDYGNLLHEDLAIREFINCSCAGSNGFCTASQDAKIASRKNASVIAAATIVSLERRNE